MQQQRLVRFSNGYSVRVHFQPRPMSNPLCHCYVYLDGLFVAHRAFGSTMAKTGYSGYLAGLASIK